MGFIFPLRISLISCTASFIVLVLDLLLSFGKFCYFYSMQKLNLPPCDFRLKSNENKTLIFDSLRKKYLVLTPEEWVRQHYVQYLVAQKKYPVSLIAIEKQLTVNGLKKRTDIVVFSRLGVPDIIVECKAPSVNITQATFDQIARYNMKLNARLLVVTNGLQHYYCTLDKENKRYIFLRDLPEYERSV